MDCGLSGSNGVVAALHVVSDTGKERVSVTISNRDMVNVMVIERALLMLNIKYVVDQNVSVRIPNIIICRKRSLNINEYAKLCYAYILIFS